MKNQYGEAIHEFVLFIEGEDLMDKYGNNLIKRVDNAYKKMMKNENDFIFRN